MSMDDYQQQPAGWEWQQMIEEQYLASANSEHKPGSVDDDIYQKLESDFDNIFRSAK